MDLKEGSRKRRQSGRVRVGYLNMVRGFVATHSFLQFGVQNEIEVLFVEECWMDRCGVGTQAYTNYVRMSQLTKGAKV